jgi:hypothetical protein
MRYEHCNDYRVKAIPRSGRRLVLRGMRWRRRLVKLSGLGGRLKLWRVCEDVKFGDVLGFGYGRMGWNGYVGL